MNNGRKGSQVSYNVHTAVDAEHKLIVAHEVTNAPIDRHQLASMSKRAKKALKSEELTVLADRGYYTGEGIRECHLAGIKALVPKSYTSNSKAAGRFDKEDFVYDGRADQYNCPAGEALPRRHCSIEAGMTIHYDYASQLVYQDCKLKSNALQAKNVVYDAGNMRGCWMPWLKSCVIRRMLCRCERARWSIRSGP